MKQPPEYMESIRLAAQMPSCQDYKRGTILRLLEHIDALEKELYEAKKTNK